MRVGECVSHINFRCLQNNVYCIFFFLTSAVQYAHYCVMQAKFPHIGSNLVIALSIRTSQSRRTLVQPWPRFTRPATNFSVTPLIRVVDLAGRKISVR
jgi:hypothetical protein